MKFVHLSFALALWWGFLVLLLLGVALVLVGWLVVVLGFLLVFCTVGTKRIFSFEDVPLKRI